MKSTKSPSKSRQFVRRTYQKIAWIAAVTSQLGGRPLSKAKLAAGGLLLLITDGWNAAVTFSVKLRAYNQSVLFHFQDIGDYGLLHEAMIEEVYDLPGPTPNLILDLGSNIGTSILYFRLKYPEARIVGFEPDPDNFRRLEQNTQYLRNVQLHNAALWSSDGYIDFFVDPHRGSSSSTVRRRNRQNRVRVEARTLDRVIEDLNVDTIDLLKFDIEGAESEVLTACSRLDQIDTVIGEVHADIANMELESLLAALRSADHDVSTRTLAPYRDLLMARKRSLSDDER